VDARAARYVVHRSGTHASRVVGRRVSGDSRGVSAPDGPPEEGVNPSQAAPTAEARRRPTGLIVLCALLALAAVGFAVWAFSAQSDADDAEEKLAAQQQAAQAETAPEPTAAPDSGGEAPDAADEELQSQLDALAAELGTVGESVEDVQQQIDGAQERVDEAQAARDEAANAVDTARAELDAFRAQAELAATCLRGTFDSVAAALESGGAEAAVTQLQQLAGDCRGAVESG
jgi:hypothetical protein